MIDVRTARGKLVGKLDEQTGSFHIKDGNKKTMIIIPPIGLKINFDSGNGVIEEIFIPPLPNADKVA